MLNQDNNLSARSSEQAWLLVQLPAQTDPRACQNTPGTSQRIHEKGTRAQNAQQDTVQTVLGSPGKLNDPRSSSSVHKHSPASPSCLESRLLPEPRQLPKAAGLAIPRELLPSEG